MAGVPQKALNWLWDVLRREYRDPQRTYSDIVRTLTGYPSFAPRTDVYTFENGSSALLLHLNGTVSVNFRGAQYRFPIAIWVPQTYPLEPPMIFVTPTPDMAIRPGQHVSASDGRIYHPYLAQWKDAAERSNIPEFVALLADVFAKEPPVVAKRQMPDSRSQPPPRPPLPQQQQPSQRQGSIPGAGSPGAPQLPPKAPPSVNGSTEQMNRGPVPSQSRYDVPPPLPQDPYSHSRQQSASPQVVPPAIDNRFPSRNNSLRDPYGGTSGVQPPPNNSISPQSFNAQRPPPQQLQHPSPQAAQNMQPQYDPRRPPVQQGYQQATNQPNVQPYPQHPPQQPYPPPQQLPQQQRPPPQQAPKPKPVQDLMDDSPFDISLNSNSKIDLPIPVIPPNPEKTALLATLSHTLHQHLQTQIAQAQSAIPALQSQHAALADAQANMRSELSQLQTLQSQLNANISALNTTLSSADRTIKSAKKQASENEIQAIDEMIIPPTVVARQLYDSVAEQRGYEAAILALTEGLVRGRIGSDVWGRKTRECAREEFKRKWLVRRIGQGMALDSPDG